MEPRIRPLFSLALAILVLAAAPLAALKVGRIGLGKAGAWDVLTIQTDGPCHPRLGTADGRIVISVPKGERALKSLALSQGPVRRIRFGVDRGVLRIVLDLRRRVAGRIIHVTAKGFEVELRPLGAAGTVTPTAMPTAVAAAGSPTAEALAVTVSGTALGTLNPAAAGYTYRVVDLELGGDETHSELVISADGPADYSSSVRDGGRLLRLDFHNSSLAWSGDDRTLKDDCIASVTARQVGAAGESKVRIDVHLTGRLDYAFKRDQNQLVVRLLRPQKPEPPPAKGDLDAPVSLDVQGADLVGVLKTLCDQAGFDYQFTRSLLAKTPPESLVTMKVQNRPFHEVLDTLLTQVQASELRLGNTIYMGLASEIDLRRNRLPVVTRSYEPRYLTAKQITQYLTDRYIFDDTEKERIKSGITTDPRNASDMLLVGTPEEVADWLAYIRQVDVAGGDGGDDDGGNQPVTQVFHLDYLDNTNAALINGAIAQLYPDGETAPTPLIDPGTRTLVVTTTPRYLRKIAKVLARIDVRPLQVNIEGKIVEVDQSVASEIGVNWTSTSSLPTGSGNGTFNTNFTPPFTSQLTYGTVINAATVAAQIQALVDKLKADIVSAPNITTIDNQPATISTTQVQVYVQTTTTISNGVVTNANTFPTSNVPLTLVVTPKISRIDHRILMNINFQLTTTEGQAPALGAPLPTNQESAITNVTVNSGDTFVIGGLVKQNNTEEARKVPFLGDIPLLGLLFRVNSVNKSKSEIIIFIKPTIVGD